MEASIMQSLLGGLGIPVDSPAHDPPSPGSLARVCTRLLAPDAAAGARETCMRSPARGRMADGPCLAATPPPPKSSTPQGQHDKPDSAPRGREKFLGAVPAEGGSSRGAHRERDTRSSRSVTANRSSQAQETPLLPRRAAAGMPSKHQVPHPSPGREEATRPASKAASAFGIDAGCLAPATAAAAGSKVPSRASPSNEREGSSSVRPSPENAKLVVEGTLPPKPMTPHPTPLVVEALPIRRSIGSANAWPPPIMTSVRNSAATRPQSARQSAKRVGWADGKVSGQWAEEPMHVRMDPNENTPPATKTSVEVSSMEKARHDSCRKSQAEVQARVDSATQEAQKSARAGATVKGFEHKLGAGMRLRDGFNITL